MLKNYLAFEEFLKDLKCMPHETTVAVSIIKKWIENPISRAFLKFVTRNDKCGNRLSLAIDCHLGKKVKACNRCKLAGKIVTFVIGKGKKFFNVKEEDIRKNLENIFLKRSLINVLKGIAEYGVTLPQKLYAPFLVVWDFTHGCNLKCRHCYQDAKEKLSDELTTEEGKKLIDQLVEVGVTVLAFSGGEPLIRNDFFELAEYARKRKLHVSLATNGTLITKDVAKKLKDIGLNYVEISLDGKDSKTHNEFRGVPDMFEKTIEGIKNCVTLGLHTGIATTVTSRNYDQIEEIYNLVLNLGVERLICFNFIPVGRGVDLIDEDLSPEQREKLHQFLAEKNCQGSVEALSTAPQIARVSLEKRKGLYLGHYFQKDLEQKDKTIAEFVGGCGAGTTYCAIEPNGDVQPCVFIPIKLGNVREKSFLDIWQNSPILQKLRDRSLLKGHCGECQYKFLCGGCRARAFAYFKDLSAPDPGCINNKKYWQALKMKFICFAKLHSKTVLEL